MDQQAEVLIIACLAISAVLVVRVIASTIIRYAEGQRRRDEVTPSIQERLDRIEVAVDAIAIEVERLGEHQRFNAQLAMNRPEPLPPRAITPH